MMSTRAQFKMKPDGMLVGPGGEALGRLVELTLDLPEPSRKEGELDTSDSLTAFDFDVAVDFAVKEEPNAVKEKKGCRGNNPRETAIESNTELAWAYWLERAKPKRTALGKGSSKFLRRAFTENYTLEDVKSAIDGLLKTQWYHDHNKIHLSSIFSTKPGGESFEDKVDGFIETGQRKTQVSPPSRVVLDRVSANEDIVSGTWNDDRVKDVAWRDKAIAALAGDGVTVSAGPDGRPVFGREWE